MDFTQAGVILYTQNYRECVDFYGDALELDLMFEIDRAGEKFTTFSLGGIYLMIEPGGTAHVGVKSAEKYTAKFRFNVTNLQAACNKLRRKGVSVAIIEHHWGTTAEFSDPDGNKYALTSSSGFGS